ncbi:hypothetical protein [Phenylobacterium sp.]|uniref:hypothetical protein n=1 Tax=Phenylobacterium sp. TaxID=1871053 RepID=UPI002E37A4D5|nr:hypothetical protein [Phenylobacterium sp.]HEX2559951.1 hypothetical protein [Phenylobacterium sp.]
MPLKPWLIFAAVLSSGPAFADAVPPAEVAAAVAKAAPQMKITGAELKERDGRRYYDVEGELPGGGEIELDLLQTPAGWEVVEVQRDIGWAAAPQAVRTAAAGSWRGPDPARVIESRQTDGAVIYELFAPGRPQTPALEVMLKHGAAKVLAEVWPH